MITNPTDKEQSLIFAALVHAIKTNSGIGFHHADQGHPAYKTGAEGHESEKWGDSPMQNHLFRLLASFDRRFHEEEQDLSSWQKFCSFAVWAYDEAQNQQVR
jgi:hypothetical protein